jgi:hypothetical protein
MMFLGEYSIENSVIGFFPQVKDEPISYIEVEVPDGRKRDKEYFFNAGYQRLEGFSLYSKAKPTDFISTINFYYDFALVTPDFASFLRDNTQLRAIDAPVLYKGKTHNYQLVQFQSFADAYVDIPECKFYLKRGNDYIERLQFGSFDALASFKKECAMSFGETMVVTEVGMYEPIFKPGLEDLDVVLFSLNFRPKKVVYVLFSEKLKQEIESRGFTGIQFKPYEPASYSRPKVDLESLPLRHVSS